MKVRELNKVVDFIYETRINNINDIYTLFRERFKIRDLPMYHSELIDNIMTYINMVDNIDYIGINNGIPELRIRNIDIQDLVVTKITQDFIVYVGWEKNQI
ncbi:MAG: hypothetical protein IJZ79_03740 [Bacilli bacterium]|nr:hypothetical protein [Bacilli bacterium]MBQ8218842.1 hypothetical protein [Bacilli bacterium]